MVSADEVAQQRYDGFQGGLSTYVESIDKRRLVGIQYNLPTWLEWIWSSFLYKSPALAQFILR